MQTKQRVEDFSNTLKIAVCAPNMGFSKENIRAVGVREKAVRK